MKALTKQTDYNIYVACSPSSWALNYGLRHAAIGLDVLIDGQKEIIMTDFGSAVIPSYGDKIDPEAREEAHQHFCQRSLKTTLEASTIVGTQLIASGHWAEALASIITIGFVGLMYAGHKQKPGALITQDIAARPDSYQRSYFQIKVNEGQYRKLFDKIRQDEGKRPFSVWHKNCSTNTLNGLRLADIWDEDFPVRKRLGTYLLNITTPRYVERVMEHLQRNDLDVKKLKLNDDGLQQDIA
ncbi:MAG: hypothetical protein AB8B83_08165 [Bdellovibrionales bacterium]